LETGLTVLPPLGFGITINFVFLHLGVFDEGIENSPSLEKAGGGAAPEMVQKII
jgi:hypothetical protein